MEHDITGMKRLARALCVRGQAEQAIVARKTIPQVARFEWQLYWSMKSLGTGCNRRL
jgi:hypothetical protein